jgi:hypothetical protein
MASGRHRNSPSGRARIATYVVLVAGIALAALHLQWTPADAAWLTGLRVSETGGASVSSDSACPGDCNEDGQVTVDEILRIVDIILGTLPQTSCPVLTEAPTIADVIQAVNASLIGCPQTPSPGSTPSPTETPIIRLTPFTLNLAAGSQIVHSSPPAPLVIEPLSGSLTLVFREYVPQFFDYDITALEFHSPSFAITQQSQNDAGDVQVGIDCPSSPIITFRVLINGERWALSTISGEITTCPPDLSTISSFEVCNPIGGPLFCPAIRSGTQAGYSITIVPALEP